VGFGGDNDTCLLRGLGRYTCYTHRVAISNNRLLDIAEGKVTFRYKDYLSLWRPAKTLTLEAEEFIRRFPLHVLPEGFQRIRYYGFWPTDTENRN
jgi:Putative transposase